MRFESVTAHAFGPISDKTIQLARNMTVICGPNESGKSTWHAALYAGLCGIRRPKGAPRSEDRDFAARHKPRDSERWEVSVRVELDDGRRMELWHDLEGKASCQVTDLTLGRDASGDFINEGTPDGAKWLGLDRQSFLATACVRQAQILDIRGAPNILREYLQRAATTAHTDATAAEAIERIKEFQTENVGRHWVKTRPLGKALERLREAELRKKSAENEQQEFLRLVTRAEELRGWAEKLRAELRLVEAAVAVRDAQAAATRLSRAKEIAQRYPDEPPPGLREDDELARKVAAAIAAWEGRPRVSELSGQTAAELRERLDRLPRFPSGDIGPDSKVLKTQSAYREVARTVELHSAQRPPEPSTPAAGGASEQELRALADGLETAEPLVDPALQERFQYAKRRAEYASSRRRISLLSGVGLSALAAGLGLIVSSATIVGALVLVAIAVLAAWMLVRTSTARADAVEELRAAENALGEARHALAEAKRRKDAAQAQVSALGLPMDPLKLRSLANEVSLSTQQQRELERWEQHHQSLSDQLAVAEDALTRALHGRGIQIKENVALALEAYLSACAERAQVAAAAMSRPELEKQLANRLAAEEARQRATDAERTLKEAAASCGVAGGDPEGLANALRTWQERRTAALELHQKALQEWAELKTLLADRTISEMEQEATRKREVAETCATGLHAGQISALSREEALDGRLASLRSDVEEALRDADNVQGQAEDRAHWLPSVVEAEEEVDRAKQELDRVRRLERTLERTLDFLERAQEKVHRTMAPILAQTVKRWLPEVTEQRYTDATVDPESLEVKVRDRTGRWCEAAVLSHGTAEQVYLLLRIAMAEHLTAPGKTCPLILDDVTVQSDRMRTEAIMRCLQLISRERQVVMFTQEEELLDWSQANLDSTQDRIVRLDVIGASG